MRVRGSDPTLRCVIPGNVGISDLVANLSDESHLEVDWNNLGADVPGRIIVTTDPNTFTGFDEVTTDEGTTIVSLSDPSENNIDVITVFQVQNTCGEWVELARYTFNTGS